MISGSGRSTTFDYSSPYPAAATRRKCLRNATGKRLVQLPGEQPDALS